MKYAPQLYGEESQFQPLYNQMQQGIMGSNIGYYSNALINQMAPAQTALDQAQRQAVASSAQQYNQYSGSIGQTVLAQNPALAQLYGLGQQQLGATADPALQALYGQAGGLSAQAAQQTGAGVQQLQGLAQQAGAQMQPINQQLQSLYGQVMPMAQQGVGQLQGLAAQAAADTRSPLWQATAANVQGNLGQLDPLTQQLSDTAQQQLALGGSLSPSQLADVTQQARAAYSARGMLGASGSIAAEVLGRTSFQQQLLQQREQFAGAVDPLVQQQLQQRTANAMGMSQADIAATQANRQLAGNLYSQATGLGMQGLQVGAGIQGQIGQNIQNTISQQAGLAQAAIGTQQQGLSQQYQGLQLQQGLQQSVLDQIYRQQAAGAQNLGNVYANQAAVQSGILGSQSNAANWVNALYGGVAGMGTGSPNLFQGSGMLQLVNQSRMAQMNANAAANQMNAQSQGAASGAMISAGGAIAGAAVTGIAIF